MSASEHCAPIFSGEQLEYRVLPFFNGAAWPDAPLRLPSGAWPGPAPIPRSSRTEATGSHVFFEDVSQYLLAARNQGIFSTVQVPTSAWSRHGNTICANEAWPIRMTSGYDRRMGEKTINYSIIQPPFSLPLIEMAKRDLGAYRTWFHQVAPQRISELAKAVISTAGYEGWKPDATPDSLDLLGQWFETQVETRKQTPEELEETRAKLTFPIDIPEEDLTHRTLSLAMDIGMYFGEVILKNLPGTKWDQPLKNKKFVDYGQPVIMGFGTVPLNPVRVMIMTAYGISDQKPARLRELYDTWVAMRS